MSRSQARDKDRQAFLSDIRRGHRPITIYRHGLGDQSRSPSRSRNTGHQCGSGTSGSISPVSEYHDAPSSPLPSSDEELERIVPEPQANDAGSHQDRKLKVRVHFDQCPEESDYERRPELYRSNERNRNPARVFSRHVDDKAYIRNEDYSSDENDVRPAGHTEDRTHVRHEDDHKDEKSLRKLIEGYEKKRLFICCDGTWQNASGTMTPLTNVAKLARAVDRLGRDTNMLVEGAELYREHGEQENTYVGLVRQIVYYSSGIGGQTALNIERGFSGLTGKGTVSIKIACGANRVC
ncbi:hypothetical protein CABS01_13288 [Colletotrichum abscissum]|uniref:uncharacterized protein n=1 Tax=Colletotrichum abscissum TaxID=1671311 RepID=UPI0027D54604|nr:uncharacterized protein CABS01_13288 [Colletotrichum abscissum]KAK1486071.1 hypothetical protein CABS01_13288 [Colletotrichum abscissum]